MSTDQARAKAGGRPANRMPAALRWFLRRWGGPREVYISLLLWLLLSCVTAFHFFIWHYRFPVSVKALDMLGLVTPPVMLEAAGGFLRYIRPGGFWLFITVPFAAWVAIRLWAPRSGRWIGGAICLLSMVVMHCYTFRLVMACEESTGELHFLAQHLLEEHVSAEEAQEIRQVTNARIRGKGR